MGREHLEDIEDIKDRDDKEDREDRDIGKDRYDRKTTWMT